MIATTSVDNNDERVWWLIHNRGTLQKIASTLRVSHGKVRATFHGMTRTPDPRVTRALAKAGAPGFTRARAA